MGDSFTTISVSLLTVVSQMYVDLVVSMVYQCGGNRFFRVIVVRSVSYEWFGCIWTFGYHFHVDVWCCFILLFVSVICIGILESFDRNHFVVLMLVESIFFGVLMGFCCFDVLST